MPTDATQKYTPFRQIPLTDRQWPSAVITRPPIWCSVDLRDGNQALIEPMDADRKARMFKLLVELGFKEIEVGFPAASDTDFAFVRQLIEGKMIPEDVTIQVLTQARPELIERTFESLKGVHRAIVHLYNSTSTLQRRVVFGLDEAGITDIAVRGAKLVKRLADARPETRWIFEYSPESFTGTELEFARDVCAAVIDVFESTPEHKMIINLPATVEMATPNIYADQIEWCHRNFHKRDSFYLSLHPHNDRGTGVAAAELGFMAGADRIEGTLFGNGERTGNVDIVTLALNMYTQGVDPALDFSRINEVRQTAEYCNQLPVHPRHPYGGDLVFTAFSGSHQDAIKKGLDRRGKETAADPNIPWGVPYLTIDPQDIGRSYEAIIRINSQSGKGGVAYVLDREHGFELPKSMHPQVGKRIYDLADEHGRELSADEIREAFFAEFVNLSKPLDVLDYELIHQTGEQRGQVKCQASVLIDDEEKRIEGLGNGPINAFVHALEGIGLKDFKVTDYRSHAVRGGSDASAAAYVQVQHDDGRLLWGAGVDSSIEMAGLKALVTAWNLLRA